MADCDTMTGIGREIWLAWSRHCAQDG